jgi:tRNA/rRNA methyltransferase
VPRVRLVLVRPETAVNVGACARVARNTGAAGLDLVRPGDWRTVECWRSAWGAQELLEQARVFDDLGQALAGAALSVALSGRRRADGPALEDVRDAAAAVAALGPGDAAALVFGPETSGLSNDEIEQCGRVALIPSHPAQPSFNLSHAVAIAAYEVHRASRRHAVTSPRRATHDEKERVLGLLGAGLRAISAFTPSREASALAGWRALVHRCELSPRELRLLEHAARKMASRGRG